MNHKKSLFLLIFNGTVLIAAQKGVIIEPVTDLVGQPLDSAKAYDDLPWSCYRNHYAASPRLHQVLLHEIVSIEETRGDQVRVTIPQIYYISRDKNAPQHSYWMLKRCVMPLKEIDEKTQSQLPSPLSFAENKSLDEKVVTLINPYSDSHRSLTYSAGTRFVLKDTLQDSYQVYCLDGIKKKCILIQLPKKNCYRCKSLPKERLVQAYVDVLRAWIQQPGIIPYVLGGCSFTGHIRDNCFKPIEKTVDGKKLRIYQRTNEIPGVKAGLDCSGIIARATQIVGIPYYFKNTYTLQQKLKPVGKNERVKNGDLIWFTGHVLVVADVEKNTIIEAHSYDGKFGKLHEAHVSQLFKNIHSIKELHAASYQKKRLERLDAEGNVYLSYNQFSILSMESVWETV